MADLTTISKEICKSKNLDKNLTLYINNMITLYSRFSYIKLSMNYYTFADLMADNTSTVSAELKGCFEEVNTLIENVLIAQAADEDYEDAAKKVAELRTNVMKTMEIVTAYVDRLSVFEHILNRVEFRFDEDELDEDYYEGAFANDILNYILSDRDNVVINSKISELVAQLPMRLTRNKFFELVKDAFGLYKGQESSALDDFIYMISTVSGIHMPEGFEAMYPDMNEILTKLAGYSYKDMDKDAFDEARNLLNYAVSYITKLSDLYVQLMEIINDVLVIFSSKKHGYYDYEEIKTSISIMDSVMHATTGMDELMDDLTDKFISFEGKQEKIYAQISSNDYVIDEIAQSFEEQIQQLELTDAFAILRNVSLLSSGSNFVALDVKKDSKEVTQERLDELFEQYAAVMGDVFKQNTQIYNRAVMALVLAGLPVFFNNTDEIMNYIKTSLSQCSDIAERKACLSLIRSLMME